MAAACGAGLGICGVILQSLLRNPLADPFVLGISSGASTGAVIVGVLGVGGAALGLSGGAFIGALVAFGLVLLLARLSGGSNDRVILAGVARTQLFSALTSFVIFAFADSDETRGVMFWLLGSLEGVRWDDVTAVRGGRAPAGRRCACTSRTSSTPSPSATTSPPRSASPSRGSGAYCWWSRR